ncbi:hypothetical protein HanPSC8_Chr17g0786671 [Helianthus annuus]|nr:hypothetical protein HanPSC8_Chr17g0786671 [Helianthus annuus]
MNMNPLCLKPMIISDFLNIKEAKILKMSVDKMSHRDTPATFGESEPPHIKNWFSSYEYESFVLETNDNFGFSEHQGSEDFENEGITGNTLKQTENSRELVTNGKNEGLLI